MDVRIVSAGSSQDVMVGRGVGGLRADIDQGSVNGGKRSSVYETVDKRRVRILINLLDFARHLGWLRPVVILHGDDKDCFDFLRSGDSATQGGQENGRTQYADSSEQRHAILP